MNAWRWLGLSIFLIATVCLLSTNRYSAFAQGADDKKVEISAKPDKATVKPGDSKTVDLDFKRGAKADKEVVLSTSVEAKDPKGVTVKLSTEKVGAKDKAAKLTVETTAATPEGDYKVTVKAKSDGSDTAATFTLTVKKEEAAKKETPPPTGAWKFKAFDNKGKPFYVEQTTKTTQDIKVMGQNVQQKQEQTFLIEWTPVDGGADYVVKQKIIGVKMEINIGGNKISYDSITTKQKNPMTDFFEALTKQELKFTIEKDLKVKSIDGRKEFIDKLSEINPQMKSLLEKILSDKALAAMAEPAWAAFPKDGDATKKEWTRMSDLDLGPIGKYKTEFTFKPKDSKGTKETIGITTKLTYTAPGASEKSGLPFIIHDAKLTSSDGTGTTVFDTATGRFDSTNLTMKLTGNLQIEVGGMKTTVELTQEQTSTSNTYDRENVPAAWKDALK
jgi:hypothetical protein